MDLVINILYVFYSFSHFSQFHQIIETYDVGTIVIKTIEYEDRRYSEIKKAKPEDSDSKKKIKIMLEKQEKLLYVCFHILLNLAEDINAELQMKKQKIIPYLKKNLERKNVDLLTLTVTFLKKLSIFQENKNEMIKSNILDRLIHLLDNKNEGLVSETLRLLLNLSFDTECRRKISDAIPVLTKLIQIPSFHEVCVRLLYHVSQDEKGKSNFQYTDIVPIITEYVIEYPEQKVNKELIALAINIATNERNGERMVSNRGLKRLMERLVRTQDPLLAKLIRNLSQFERIKPLYQPFVPSIVALATKASQPDFLVEMLGVFGNMTFSNYAFEGLFKQYNLIPFLQGHLQIGMNEDDIILETIICVGVVVSNEDSAYIVSESNLVKMICELFVEKQDDDEIALQILYTFFKFVTFKSTRESLLKQKQIIHSLVNLLQDKNVQIRKMTDQILEVIMHFDSEWSEVLTRKKFESYNEHWLQSNINLNRSMDSTGTYSDEGDMGQW